ncbi:hypothetical protein AAG570_012532 [Ranatra chinensis]|uniref:Uncharacterized protein n=1 Tax=Ranatra chinensis TaxID=642074 RepID=A0ABD0YEA2_9HEMI
MVFKRRNIVPAIKIPSLVPQSLSTQLPPFQFHNATSPSLDCKAPPPVDLTFYSIHILTKIFLLCRSTCGLGLICMDGDKVFKLRFRGVMLLVNSLKSTNILAIESNSSLEITINMPYLGPIKCL